MRYAYLVLCYLCIVVVYLLRRGKGVKLTIERSPFCAVTKQSWASCWYSGVTRYLLVINVSHASGVTDVDY